MGHSAIMPLDSTLAPMLWLSRVLRFRTKPIQVFDSLARIRSGLASSDGDQHTQ